GAITRVERMRKGSYYYCCPWSPVYQVHRPVKINGKQLSVPQQFTFDVSGEELADGGSFVRRIVLGPFQPTDEVDYCDPSSGHHHDGRTRPGWGCPLRKAPPTGEAGRSGPEHVGDHRVAVPEIADVGGNAVRGRTGNPGPPRRGAVTRHGRRG